jgi:DNA-binding NarL/FixJ family response regulator
MKWILNNSGSNISEWLRINYPSVKVLALSTMESETSIIKMIKHGARGYVLKDAEPAELKKAFDELSDLGFFYNEQVTKKVMQSVNQLSDEKSQINKLLNLTPREIEFIKLTCSEKSYQAIAKEMVVSHRTVDGYRDALFKKLNVTTRVGIVLYAVKHKIITIN